MSSNKEINYKYIKILLDLFKKSIDEYKLEKYNDETLICCEYCETNKCTYSLCLISDKYHHYLYIKKIKDIDVEHPEFILEIYIPIDSTDALNDLYLKSIEKIK